MLCFRNKIFLILVIIFSLSNVVFAETKSSSMTIEIIDETNNKSSAKTENKQETISTSKSSAQKQQATKPIHIPYTGWMQIPNTLDWVYFLQDMPLTGWQYITGNGWDGWYYFDVNSFLMLRNTYTPDGYFVDASGKWVQNYNVTRNSSNVIVNQVTGEIINNNSNDKVKDSNSKYLYNRVEYTINSKSITTSTKLGDETISKNIIRLTNNGSILLPNSNKYTKLIFNYLVEEPNGDNEYDLQILVNGELEDELDSFIDSKQVYTLEFDENSSIEFKWHVNTEDGSKSAKAVNLYIYSGILEK